MNMGLPVPSRDLVERFRRDLEAIAGVGDMRLGVAVSGGPDSLALLLLAAAACPAGVEAATVEHGLRPESAAEAQMVADVAGQLGIAHIVLAPAWAEAPASNVPAAARAARYDSLCGWGAERRLTCILTAHHMDDQAETLLMRAARGAGLSGMAGVRPITDYVGARGHILLVRPLLGWRKAELDGIVAAAGLSSVVDPTNDDPRLDRTHARRLLRETAWLDASRLAACASHLGDAETALRWVTEREFEARSRVGPDGTLSVEPSGLPRELQRRLLLQALSHFPGAGAPPGPKVDTLLATLLAGGTGMLGEARVRPGPPWRFERAPPRRR